MASNSTSDGLDQESSTREVLQQLRSLNPKWLRVYWVDHSSMSRCRLIPIKQVYQTLEQGKPIALSITECCLGLLPNDVPLPGVAPVGAYNLHADWSSLKRGPVLDHVSCYGEFKQLDGSECILCPRTILRKTLERAATHGLRFRVGFEIEFIALELDPDPASPQRYRPVCTNGHGWSTSRALASWGQQGSFSTVLDDMVDNLDAAGIDIEMLHVEASAGQYEIVLLSSSPLEACDTLLHARQTIESSAARHGFAVTLHPKPWAEAVGSASHAHVSISSPGGHTPEVYEHFYAGILKHLPALLAFACPSPVSYARLVDGYWAGGRWVAWGTQNRETPLRKCEDGHWEFKSLDGIANPFLAIAVILNAGISGITEKIPLTWGDCRVDPSTLTDQQRSELGVTEMLPADLTEALEALSADEKLVGLLDPKFVQRYIDTKKGEIAILAAKSTDDARQWTLERY